MAPKIEPNETNRTLFQEYHPQENFVNRQPIFEPLPADFGVAKQSNFIMFGNQQKDRLERLYGAGSGAVSAMRDVALAGATKDANWAFARTYKAELKALKNPSTSANPPKDLIEVSRRAETAYRGTLAEQGFTPSDVRGASVVKTADFLRAEAKKPGDFTTSSPAEIGRRLAANEPPKYFVRVMEKSRLDASKAHLSNPNSPHVWLATPEELAGAKLDGFETMKRVGFSDSYIAKLKADGKTPADFVLVVSEARGVKRQKPPTWDNVIDAAVNHKDFATFKRKFGDPDFFNQVKSPTYKARYEEMKRLGLTDVEYARTLPKSERGAFLFRNEMNSTLGVNEFFTGNGRTERTDGQNSGVGVREVLGGNDEVPTMQRNTFVELSETGKTNLRITENTPTIADNPLRLRGEMRTGGLMGGTISAVTSLPEVFEQANRGDYAGAAQTFALHTGGGATLGALSSGGERIVGRSLENALSRSTFAESGLEKLYESGAARSFASRLAGQETSNISSQAFNSTLRTLAGRVGGAGVVGGLVSGGFAAYDQIGAYRRGEVTASQAIGTVTGEAAVGVGAGMAGAAAGAAIGSIIPGAGTIVGGVIGFGVGMLAGYLADKGLRGLGVNTMIAKGVTATIDAGAKLVGGVEDFGKQAVNTISSAATEVKNTVDNAVHNVGNAISGGLKSVFGW